MILFKGHLPLRLNNPVIENLSRNVIDCLVLAPEDPRPVGDIQLLFAEDVGVVPVVDVLGRGDAGL